MYIPATRVAQFYIFTFFSEFKERCRGNEDHQVCE